MLRPAILRTQQSGMVLELMPISICVGRLIVNESRESGDGEFKTSDVLITVLTSAALPVASRILTLSFGDNSLWSVDRLFIIYFASFSGWILRSYLQLVVERSGMRDKGYRFMDSDAAGNAVWTFPVVLALFCWNLLPGLITLLVIYGVAAFLLLKYRSVFCIDAGRMGFIGLCTLLTVVVMEAVFVDYLSDPPSEIYQFVIYTMTLVLIISFNYVLDRFRIKRFGRK